MRSNNNQSNSQDNKRKDRQTLRLPSITGDSKRDWCLWQLAQVLREIAQSATQSRDNTVNRKEASDNENK